MSSNEAVDLGSFRGKAAGIVARDPLGVPESASHTSVLGVATRNDPNRPGSDPKDPGDRSQEEEGDPLSESLQRLRLTEGSAYGRKDPNPLNRVKGRDPWDPSLVAPPAGSPDLRVVIPGKPTSWKRTSGKQRHTERSQRIAAQRIRIAVREALSDGWSRAGRFAVLVESHYAGGLEELVEVGEPHRGAKSEGDWDNLGKLPSDALQGIVWDDDRQIVDGRSLKRYGCRVEQVLVAVWRVRR